MTENEIPILEPDFLLDFGQKFQTFWCIVLYRHPLARNSGIYYGSGLGIVLD